MPISQKEFQQRRQDLMNHMEPNSIAIVQAAPSVLRNGDTEFRYRQSSDLYYLTGLNEAQAVLVLIPGREQGQCLLFCQEKDPLKELWNGKLLGPEAAIERLGMDDAFPITDIDDILPGLIEGRERVYFSLGKDPEFDQRVMEWVNVVRKKVRSGAHSPGEFLVLDHLLHEQRLIKSKAEIDLMREAGQIAVRAHKRAMQVTRPGMYEYEVEAEFMHEFFRAGCRAPAYTSIVAGGANACILHYTDNDQVLKDGDLLLIDAGCEFEHYASDITRTFPVNGRFSGPQRELYELVLAAQAAAIEATAPGRRWNEPHDAAVRVLAQGFIDLGLCKGSLDGVLEQEQYKQFYMHRTGHWLGLDVHDAGEYKQGGEWLPLEPGMVLTVEPGCYVRPGEGVPEQYWNIGIRIEDDVVVTESGCEVITGGVPKTVADIEALMRDGR